MFIGFLMAGMANVFKSSVSTLATSSEGISSARRNRMSIDLLYDDLNTAALYITDLTAIPSNVSTSNPVFYVLPNMQIPGVAVGDPDNPQTSDELFFYLDQPLPFEGTLAGTGGGVGAYAAKSAAELANVQGVAGGVVDNSYAIDCGDPSYAKLVQAGHSVVIKDSWDIMTIDQAQPISAGSQIVGIHVAANATVAMTGIGASGAAAKTKHIHGSAVLFYQPAQMVHYAVRMKYFDPQKPAGIPCLVREQENYSPTGWDAGAATLVQTVIAENVAGIDFATGLPAPGFKIYLSADAGRDWAGLLPTGVPKDYGTKDFATGWTTGMRADLNTQLAGFGRPDVPTTVGVENWIRDVPTLVRFDITTRTATKRTEYSKTPLTTTAYKPFTQSLVIVPRHSGLTMN
jgi:hypothetical protein